MTRRFGTFGAAALVALAVASPQIASADVHIHTSGGVSIPVPVVRVRVGGGVPLYRRPRFSQPPRGWRFGFSGSVSASASVGIGYQVDSGPSCDYPVPVYTPPPPTSCCTTAYVAPSGYVVASAPREYKSFMGIRLLGGSDGSAERDEIGGGGVYARFPLSRALSIESALEIQGRNDPAAANLQRFDVPATVGLVAFLMNGPTRPYLTAGLGYAWANADDDFHHETGTYRVGYVGAGLSLKLSRRTTLDFDARWTRRTLDSHDGEPVIDSKLGVLPPLLAETESPTELRAGVLFAF